MTYKHKQIGWAIIIPVMASAIVVAYVGSMQNYDMAVGVAGLLVAMSAFFGSLTVTVGARTVEAKFGPGLIKRTFELSEIRECRHVRHSWLYGWGYRKLPNGWLMNVSGMDCVELEMKDGSVHRIGTDEPKKLMNHIRTKLGTYDWSTQSMEGKP